MSYGAASPAPLPRRSPDPAKPEAAPFIWAVLDIETRRKFPPDEMSRSAFLAGDGGMSCLCVWDSWDRWPRFYDDSPASLEAAINHLGRCDVVITWNGEYFDIPLLRGLLGRVLHAPLPAFRHFDLKQEVIRANQSNLGVTLRVIAEQTLGYTKTDDGEQIERMIARNEWARLMDYCSQDVRCLLNLILYVLQYQSVIAPAGEPVSILLPEGVR